ncbi:MAG: hypothetical protein JNK59_13005 [Sterolibacteriaceae bacterium]|jgi:hypothetical protein|uniref:hypothetical protein n=1 Tax=Sulfuritalea sp. TaxID=2480090 RepID=UPI001A5A53ED|nr:hypothetical protein [Sulfuritalea sp.]MBL8480218.1 hypothetical protein [Sterolibacteriaceae bacterium]MBN8475341.1 hypothetical protein [Sulfuritalea sp.]
MAKPNYSFEKRQRDLAKKAKKEEKRLRKASGPAIQEGTENPEPAAPPPATEVKAPD